MVKLHTVRLRVRYRPKIDVVPSVREMVIDKSREELVRVRGNPRAIFSLRLDIEAAAISKIRS